MHSSFKHKILKPGAIAVCILLAASCKKFIEIPAPKTSISQATVYESDATAIAAVTTIYANSGNTFGGTSGISFLSALSSDELTLASVVSSQEQLAYYRNQLRPGPDGSYGTRLWIDLYTDVFKCNAAIEGLNSSAGLTASVKNQLLGEARFLRAFYYFYLVNFYGDVPLVLVSDPNLTSKLARAPRADVYTQIVADLKEAQSLLSSSFLGATLLNASGERVRPIKAAATALLARVYLYMGQWANAEAQATAVIANTGLFSLAPLNSVFLKNSSEAIWQLQPVEAGFNTQDALVFVLSSTGPNDHGYPVYLSPQQLNAFESGDLRRRGGNWVDSVISGGVTYFYPAKYKAKNISGSAFTEYLMMFRLGEQYLIRAEARAQLNNFQGARDDLNMIRRRANLLDNTSNDQAALLTAILKERQVELFTELGHRWMDLKRTGKIDQVMTNVTPQKGNPNGWKTYQQLYPLPFGDLQLNPKLVQNVGY